MSRQGMEWSTTKGAMPPALRRSGKTDYPEHKRASNIYAQYISGYTEEEIVDFYNCTQGMELTVDDVKRDIQHIESMHPIRTIIAHKNDRNRILLQRTESDNYRKLIKEALETPASHYIAAGMSPQGVLKEFREAVGMTEKPGSFNVNLNQVNVAGEGSSTSGIATSEDLLRAVMTRMKARQKELPQETKPNPNLEEENIIEAEAIPVEDDIAPGFDDLDDMEDSIPDLED